MRRVKLYNSTATPHDTHLTRQKQQELEVRQPFQEGRLLLLLLVLCCRRLGSNLPEEALFEVRKGRCLRSIRRRESVRLVTAPA